MKHNLAVIIPALNPDEQLIRYVGQLLDQGFGKVIVVNDGSNKDREPIFTKINRFERTKVLTHEVNKGKGRALKTAFEYCLSFPELIGVITADADGQHHVDDVESVAHNFTNSKENIVLGVRDFSESHVPKRSYIGNRTTSLLFYLLFRKKLTDTQTGLRAIARSELKQLLSLKGERYEYEINMLIYAVKRKIGLGEVPIQTIYFNENESSHYRTVKDSLQIFNRIVRSFFNFKKENGQRAGEVNE